MANRDDIVFEDISSSSPKKKNPIKEIEEHSARAFKHIDRTIKTIAFIVAIGIFLAFVAIGFVLISLDKVFSLIALGLVIFGLVLAIIILFLIYATGHIISQNNEILKKL